VGAVRRRVAVALVAVLAVGTTAAGLVTLERVAAEPVSGSGHPAAALAGGAHLVAGGQTGSQAADTEPFRSWLESGDRPDPTSPYAALATTALADLHALTLENGGVLSSFRRSWRYVWPRDTAFAAVAFARTGHLPDALRALSFLQAIQAPDGSFQARYRPDGSGPPDGRGVQEDAPGWVVWSVDAVLAAAPEDHRAEIARSVEPLVDRSVARLLARTAGSSALPAPSSDYWEQRETRLTLGIAAPTLAGLLAGSRLLQARDPDTARLAATRADTLRDGIEREFGTSGYSRYAGGRGPDAAVTFLLPPYVDSPLPGAVTVARGAPGVLRQPADGLSPGATWPRHDGVSWTPETALFLVASAESGDAAQADGWLAWFAQHALPQRSVPEKVDAHGHAGDVAPLAWTDALVLIAMDRLDLLSPGA
jgi:glucoamylase